MARRGSGFGTKLMILILLALVAYCLWQIVSLKQEVAKLRTEVIECKARLRGSGRSVGTRSLVEDALAHAAKAKQYLARGDAKRARAEWDKSRRLMEQAGKSTTAPSVSAFRNAQRKLNSLQKAWKEFTSDEPDKLKGG